MPFSRPFSTLCIKYTWLPAQFPTVYHTVHSNSGKNEALMRLYGMHLPLHCSPQCCCGPHAAREIFSPVSSRLSALSSADALLPMLPASSLRPSSSSPAVTRSQVKRPSQTPLPSASPPTVPCCGASSCVSPSLSPSLSRLPLLLRSLPLSHLVSLNLIPTSALAFDLLPSPLLLPPPPRFRLLIIILTLSMPWNHHRSPEAPR